MTTFVTTIQEARQVRESLRITEPTPAYDIIEWAIGHIQAEPLRLHMNTWGTTWLPTIKGNAPACGTVACAAGWMGVRIFGGISESGLDVARTLAGINDPYGAATEQQVELRRALYRDVFVNDSLLETDDQSVQQVEAVVAALRVIQTNFETYLRSVMVPPGGWLVPGDPDNE